MADNRVKKAKGDTTRKALKGSIEARRYEQEGRLTPNNRKHRDFSDGAFGEMSLVDWRQQRRKEASDVSGEAARKEKIAQKNIQRTQSMQGNQERNRKGVGKKLTLSSKQRILQAIKNRK